MHIFYRQKEREAQREGSVLPEFTFNIIFFYEFKVISCKQNAFLYVHLSWDGPSHIFNSWKQCVDLRKVVCYFFLNIL